MENTMNRTPYDHYKVKGASMKKNIEIDREYEESQQLINIQEVPMALDNLTSRISIALFAIYDLKERLYSILPPESKNEDINRIEDNVEPTEFSCPLAKEIESEYRRIGEINEVIRYLLKNIKL